MRGRGLTYADAARLMGGGDSVLVRTLDAALGGILLVATAGGSELAIGLFDAKSELSRLSEQLAVAFRRRREGLGRVDRTECMAAAHTVIVITAFFEAVRDADFPIRDDVVRLSRREQTVALGGTTVSGSRLGELANALCTMPVPPLSPTMTVEGIGRELAACYGEFGRRLRGYVAGLAVWDGLSESQRLATEAGLVEDIPADAVRRWRVEFRRLAADFPELAFYVDRADHEATRGDVGRVLAGLVVLQERLAGGEAMVAESTRSALVRRYRAELDRPIVDSGDVPAEIVLPTLRQGYLDSDYRMAEAASTDLLHLEEFWSPRVVRDDLGGFLVAYLSSIEATERPLLVLGQPGAGKSVLTKIAAATLPPEQFLVVRVVLRQTPADADLQTQIEDAIRTATGEQIGWPSVSRTAGSSLRVVILDGFDELLQATGVGQSSYLREVAAFQQREADQDRPVAVVVTSRMAVADRALLPASGAVVLRLEPFRDEQVASWLELWAQLNAVGFAHRGVRPLPPAVALRHRALAEQPLLLLLLALYDADGNGLQQTIDPLRIPDLYERLLGLFARREVAKQHAALGERGTISAVRDELDRLSVAALAMFHRGRPWVTQAELDADLQAFVAEHTGPRDDFHAPVKAAADAIGRFFFVHRVRSRRGDEDLTAVEFLHATFGEYLVARLVTNELTTFLAVSELDLGGARGPIVNPDRLLEMLCFTPLTMRETVIETLGARLTELSPQRRDGLRMILIKLFRAVVTGQACNGDSRRSLSQTPAGRQALQSLNLLILVVVLGDVTARELFGTTTDPTPSWRTAALLWYSQCNEEAWDTVNKTLQIARIGDRWRRDLRISMAPDWLPEPVNPLWSVDLPEDFRRSPFGWGRNDLLDLRRTGAFLEDRMTEYLLHALDAFPRAAGSGLISHFASTHDGDATSALGALMELWLASASTDVDRSDRLIVAYDRCLVVCRWAFGPSNWVDREQFMLFLLRQAVADKSDLPETLLDRISDWYAELIQAERLPDHVATRLDRWSRIAINDFPGS